MSEVPHTTPKVPDGLSKQAAEWYRTCCRQFVFRTAAELEVLAQAAHSLTRIEECRKAIKKNGAFIVGSKGLVSHPASRMEQQHRSQFLVATRQLGISNPKHSAESDDE